MTLSKFPIALCLWEYLRGIDSSSILALKTKGNKTKPEGIVGLDLGKRARGGRPGERGDLLASLSFH